MNFAEISGQTLDGKYKIERELGRGGMGTVYLATHLGTERPVAVKVIAPQFMERPEFVERFRREARAAGRLRHPNVVDVTDFGFSDTRDGRVAYLVMEYLDGCTLGEILEEEKNLPVSWTLDILEQVCSAVQEAHEQGIIHRDLKPDNIWLEPNQRGGYTVKVLDFGIAKLEAQVPYDQNARQMPYVATTPTMAHGGRATLADVGHSSTVSEIGSDTKVSDAATVIQESGAAADRSTVIMPGNGGDQETIGTQILSDADNSLAQPRSFYNAAVPLQTVSNDSELTRVGAVLGTPLYMSPEQCRGEHLDPRSDVYSLGVIAFQMLAGDTPFKGNFSEVMDAHREIEPPSLDAKKVRKKLKRVIASALSKNPDERPQTAEAFASMLVSRSEGIFGLLRRAGMIYTEHMPKFVGLAILLYIPFIAGTLLNFGASVFFVGDDEATEAMALKVGMTILTMFTGFFCGYLAVGTTTWLVNQILSFPLRPVRIRPALIATKANWKKLIGTGVLSTALTFLGYVLCLAPGLFFSVTLALVAPVVMMENLRGRAALRRSKVLVMRSLRTTTAAVAILFFVPILIGATTGFVVAVSVKAFSDAGEKIAAANGGASETAKLPAAEAKPQEGFKISVSSDEPIRISDTTPSGKISGRIKNVVREGMTALIMLPFQILLISLSSIIVALLYLKTRLAGGESLTDLLSQFEDADRPRKKWQERVRQRLIQSGRITGKS